MRYIIALLIALFLIGCSSKKYFEPKEVAGYVEFDGSLPAPIIDILRDGATLSNGMFISEDGLEDYKLKKDYLFIKKSEGKYIAASRCKDIEVIDAKSKKVLYKKEYKLKAPIAANIKGDILAIVFDNNSLEVVDIATDKVYYSKSQKSAIANDTKIANPIFLGRLVVFPTLDGKLVIVDGNKEIRSLVVGAKESFNNVIFLKVIDNNLIAATSNKIISVNPRFTNSLDIDIADVLYVKDRVYVLSKDGEIILTDSTLEVLKTKKYPFAHFTGAIYSEYIYVIEKEGYILAVDKDLRVSNIFKFPSEIQEHIFTTKDKVFYSDRYFKLNSI
jgi:hypothetical protein